MATRSVGTLARWNADRGFGFIAPDGGGSDVFVHASDMSRIGGAPQAGWRLEFQLRPGKDGRMRAFDVQREGMPLMRPAPPAQVTRPVPPRREPVSRSPRSRTPAFAFLVVAVLGVGVFVFQRGGALHAPAVGAPMPLAAPLPTSDAPSPFKCDGRTHCSQMRSCEEAAYFLQHCPDTQMDGNGDGVPCEQQWCN